MRILTYTYICDILTYTYIYTHAHMWVYACVYIYVYASMGVCIYICICEYITCICEYTHKHTHIYTRPYEYICVCAIILCEWILFWEKSTVLKQIIMFYECIFPLFLWRHPSGADTKKNKKKSGAPISSLMPNNTFVTVCVCVCVYIHNIYIYAWMRSHTQLHLHSGEHVLCKKFECVA